MLFAQPIIRVRSYELWPNFSLSRLWPKTLNFWNARLTSPCYRAAFLTLLILQFGIQYSQPSLCRRNFTPTNFFKEAAFPWRVSLSVRVPVQPNCPENLKSIKPWEQGMKARKMFIFFIAVHITVLFFVTHPNRHSVMVSKRWEPNTHWSSSSFTS